MRTNTKLLTGLILLLTILVIVIDLPRSFTINFSTTVPIINKKIILHKTFLGFNPAILHLNHDLTFKKGLDLEGGTSVTLKAEMKGIAESQKDDALQSAKLVIDRRVNAFGVSEPVVQTSKVGNERRIIVELPGVTDVNQAVRLIGTTAQLNFWEEGGGGVGNKVATPSGMPAGLNTVVPNAQKTTLTGNDLQDATVTFNNNNAQPQVQLTFTPDGTKKFADITRRNSGKVVAIVLDNQVVEAPKVNEPILNGNAVITGSFTTEQATLLASELKAGALPVPLTVLEQHQIGASLGQSSLTKSLFAGMLGFLVIVVFMITLYGRLGALACVALILYTLIVLAIFKLIPVTLTLAGIAGFILSIGMAVDANILIFERMREELRAGRPRTAAIELGFSRAWPSIRDSNIASLITSAILFYLGTGIVKGFAATLFIGVAISLFSAVVVTRTFLRIMNRTQL